jgi:hypothetical protein
MKSDPKVSSLVDDLRYLDSAVMAAKGAVSAEKDCFYALSKPGDPPSLLHAYETARARAKTALPLVFLRASELLDSARRAGLLDTDDSSKAER